MGWLRWNMQRVLGVPKINQGYFAPTYPQIRDIFYPTVEEVAHDWGLNVKINEGNKEVHLRRAPVPRNDDLPLDGKARHDSRL